MMRVSLEMAEGRKGGEEQPTVDSGSEEEVAGAADRLESDGRETAGKKRNITFSKSGLPSSPGYGTSSKKCSASTADSAARP